MSVVKTAREVEVLAEGGQVLAHIRDELLTKLVVGAVPLQIDTFAKKLIREAGGTPSFMTVNGYQWATCINVNDVVVHGIPTGEPLKTGDVVGLDVGLLYKGFHTDTSWTKVAGNSPFGKTQDKQFGVRSEIEKFLKVGEEALERAIKQAKPGNRIGHISQAIQEVVERGGYSVVRSLVGHGIGRHLHESPQIPGVLTKPIEETPLLKPGMVVAIEVIYNMGKPDVTYKNEDGWTLATADGSISGLYEETVAVLQNGPIILTQSQK